MKYIPLLISLLIFAGCSTPPSYQKEKPPRVIENSPELPSYTSRKPEGVDLLRLERFEKGEWSSISFGLERAHGDYRSRDDLIILQKLPDGRILLSLVADGNHDLPVSKRFLSKAEAEEIRHMISEMHRTALGELSIQEQVDSYGGEERLRFMDRYFPGGYTYTEMVIRVTNPDGETTAGSKNFDERKGTLEVFEAYFNGLLPTQK